MGDEALFVFNGLDGGTGRALCPALTAEEVARLALGRPEVDGEAGAGRGGSLVLREGSDPRVLADAGWGVIFAHGADPAIREALAPLLAHRRAQAAADDERRYREFAGADGHRPNERKQAFLGRHGAPRSGAVDPDRMPYYLLIVGDPERVGFDFQAQLDLQYAVGRIHFDELADYERYARSVVAAETAGSRRAPGLTLFGARNQDDTATALACEHLIGGLAQALGGGRRPFPVEVVSGEQATKARLGRLLAAESSSLLFTSTHGVGFAADDPRQATQQGALVCQEWPGPRWSQPLPPEFYFAADDLAADADLGGVIAFLFACYGGGTPRTDPFRQLRAGPAARVAERAFLARLPTRMLAHPGGGALAVVGHVDRAWACSFHGGRSGPEIETFTSTLKRLLQGWPIGAAMEFFANRHGELAAELAAMIEESEGQPAALELANLWTANNDARNYMVIGDPAVRVASARAAAG
jgi:hypothetical protein